MSQQYISLFNTNSNKFSHSYLDGILSSSKIITINVGVYFNKYHARYKNLKDLPYIFTKGIDKILYSNSKAFCIHNGYTSVIYLFNDCNEENYESLNRICIWLTRLQTTLRTIRFCTGIDMRDIQGIKSIITSETMSHFRMYKAIHEIINNERVIMGKSISFINVIQKILDSAIQHNDYNLYSEHIMEISQYLDKLINRYMYCIPKT